MNNSITLLGDIHGSRGALRLAFEQAHLRGLNHLVQLGDWGLSWGGDGACPLVEYAQTLADEFGIHLYILLGNHERHTSHTKVQELQNSANVTLLDRSGVFWIGDHPIAYQAGGCSIDQESRVLGRSWWTQELPTDEDYDHFVQEVEKVRALDKGHDIRLFLAHDSAVKPPMRLFDLGPLLESQCQQSRRIVRQGVDYSGAQLIVHGHYHKQMELNTNFGFKQVGLANADQNWVGSMAVVNLDTLDLEWVKV